MERPKRAPKPERVVLIDADNVLFDFDKYLNTRMKERFPDLLTPEAKLAFYVINRYEDEYYQAHVENIYRDPNLFYDLEPTKNAMEGWQRTIDAGFHPIICSSPLDINPVSEAAKRVCFERHFSAAFGKNEGELIAKQALITSDKTTVKGLALVDDHPSIKGTNLRPDWTQIIYDQPYNQTADILLRIRGWDDPSYEEILKELHRARLKTL